MPQIQEIPASPATPPIQTPPPLQVGENFQTLWDETSPSKDTTSIVEWLAPTYHSHQKRVFGIVRNSHQSQLYLDRLREKHEAGKFPKSIQDLNAPKALEGLPSLQALWDEITVQYKENLFQALVNAREEKLATQYSPAIREEIIKSLIGDIKKLCADKSSADPTHQPSFEAEGRAAFSLFTSSITLWEQQAREQGLQAFSKQKDKEENHESKALDQANNHNNGQQQQGHRYHPYPQRGNYQPRGRGNSGGGYRGSNPRGNRGTTRGRGAGRGRGM
ncbi:hypothetical protein F5888DRAFT_1865078 [Russula emetica]|nr:hypothetical protein F5888DRAFT_1865078 [Russula emetica]